MWYNKIMKKILFSTVVIVMCLAAFVFGAGIGGVGGGTFNTTDSNRFVVFTSKAQFDEYATTHSDDAFNVPESERGNYDDKFFKNNALVLFLTDGMSSSIKVFYKGYRLKGSELHVTVKELSPAIHTMDLKYNTLRATVPQEIASGITKVVIETYRVNI